jgi:hypothetical protein
MSINGTNIFSSAAQPIVSTAIVYSVVVAVVIVAPVSVTAVLLRNRNRKTHPRAQKINQDDPFYGPAGVNRGECYLSDSIERCVKIVCNLHSHGVQALAIVREDPELLSKTCKVEPDNVVLLASKPIKGFKAINNLQEVSIAITKFVNAGAGVVLLDGLEYLISRFGFNNVYMCLQEKKIEFLEAGAVLLVPINFETLDSREKGELLSELKLL